MYLKLNHPQYDSIRSLVQKFEELSDTISAIEKEMEIHQINVDNTIVKHDEALKDSHTRFILTVIICVVTVLLLTAFVVVTIDRQRKQRYIRLQKQLAANRWKLLNEKSKDDEVPDANRLQKLRDQKLACCIQAFRETPWAKRLDKLERDKSAGALTKEERQELFDTLTEQFADVMADLKEECPLLNSDELLLCLYSLLGYTIPTIVKSTTYTNPALRNRKSRLKKKLPETLFNRIFP